jgi:hypothetical protein
VLGFGVLFFGFLDDFAQKWLFWSSFLTLLAFLERFVVRNERFWVIFGSFLFS